MVVRPALPFRFVNPCINIHLNATHLPPVKYQILSCQGKDILVGRLKIDTPNDGHAFILRRFDTGAVSLTTMFRAAFPNASDSEEKLEVAWVKDTYDLSGNNGSTRDTHITRLAGVWVGPAVALELGHAYMLGRLIEAVVEATPDPNGNYRRSGKSAAANAPAIAPATVIAQAVVAPSPPSIVSKPSSAVKSLPTPSPTATTNPPTKRRKESSPTVEPQSIVKPPSRRSTTPSKVSAPPPASPTLRRSARTKSPALRQPSAPPPLRTPKATRSVVKRESITLTTAPTPGSSDLTVVDEESLVVENGVVGTELRDQDIKEQQKLIQDLKDKRDASRNAQAKGEEGMDVVVDDDESSSSLHSSTTGKKREREDDDEPLKFNFKEPEKAERAISTNRRVSRFNMEPRTKSFAWGLAAFAVGMGAVAFLPNFM